MLRPHRLISLTDRTAVGEARRAAIGVAEALGFSEDRRSDIAIVATEAANNVISHARAGSLLLCPSGTPDSAWLDLLTVDSGPGIENVPAALEDGFSSGGTAGEGLGAILRQSDESGLYSLPEHGTVLWSRFYTDPERRAGSTWGAVSVPLRGETECGDAFLVCPGAARTLYMMVDGLGHGASAAEAAAEAVEITRAHASKPVQEVLLRAHDALRKTRGAAMSIAIVQQDQNLLTYAGVGNVSGLIHRGREARSLVSQNGTLGAVMPRQIQQYQYPFEPGSFLVLFSDGLNTRTSLAAYNGLANRHPQLLAGALFRDFTRGRDDASVMVVRLAGSP